MLRQLLDWLRSWFTAAPPEANLCLWHEGLTAIDYEDSIALYCGNCGRMLDDKMCDGCFEFFLDFDNKGGDDILAGPAMTEEGDLVCVFCIHESTK